MKKQVRSILSLFLIINCICVSSSYAAKWKANHVIFIGLDGWGAYSLDKANIPHIKELMKNGSYTLEKRSVLPSSSAVNWASMFMGAGPELHGYTEWGSKTPELPSREITHYGIFPSIFGLFRDNNPQAEIGYFYQWDGLFYLAEMEAINRKMNVTAQDDPSGKADRAVATQSASYIIQKKPNLVGIFFDEPDHIGHTDGHDTESYYKKLEELDSYIALIMNAVKEAGIEKETIYIVTSDHGGVNKNHGGKTMLEMQTPFIISGKGIKKGYQLTESMMQFDVAPTIAYIFGLKQPQVWIGRPMNQVFK